MNELLVYSGMARERYVEKPPIERVGDWKLGHELGRGGQCRVFQVRYQKDAHCPARAMKLCDSVEPKTRARFQREIEALSSQAHPGIVRILESGAHDRFAYYVMEKANTTLDRIASDTSAGVRILQESPALLLQFFRDICEAVAHLHSQEFLHRDIKPANILLMLDPPEPMRAVLSDLGIAANANVQGQLTATHEMIGTPAFRAPETSVGVHTAASDVYSLGKTLEFLFNRRAPVVGPNTCTRDARMSEDLWDELDNVLTRACAFTPSERFSSARELAESIPQPWLVNRRTTTRRLTTETTPLDDSELQLLADIIAKCPLDGDAASSWELKSYCETTDLSFAISIRRLLSLDLIERVTISDRHGEEYEAVRPTASGHAIVFARRADFPFGRSRTASSSISPSIDDDDVPF